MTVRLPLVLCLLVLLTGIRGQDDFRIDDPTDAPTPKKESNPDVKPDGPKPATPAPKSDPKPDDGPKPATSAPKSDPKADDDLNLVDALVPDAPAPTKKPQPGHGGGGGGGSFGDSDLSDGLPHQDPRGADEQHHGGDEEVQGPEKQSVLAGVLSAVAVAAVGAISSFIAYQKKKLCFKGQAEDPENVNMDNQKGDQNDPQAQTNLLAK